MVKKPTFKSVMNKLGTQVRGRVGIQISPDLEYEEKRLLDKGLLVAARRPITEITGIKLSYQDIRPVKFNDDVGFILFGGGKNWWVKPTLKGEVEIIYNAHHHEGKLKDVVNACGLTMGVYGQDHYTLGEVVYTTSP